MCADVCRYVLSLLACDHTGGTWMTAFNEQAEVLLGRKASDLQTLVDQGQEDAFKNVFSEKNFRQYVFRVRAQEENQRDAVRTPPPSTRPPPSRARSPPPR